MLGRSLTFPIILSNSKALKKLYKWRELVDEECSTCHYYRFCLGGCPYNAITIDERGKMEIGGVDQQCIAYKMIFGEITKRLNEEFTKSGFSADRSNSNGIMRLMLK